MESSVLNKSDILTLKSELQAAGCFEKNGWYVTGYCLIMLFLSISTIYVAFFSSWPLVVCVLSAIAANIFLMSLRFLGHDASHFSCYETTFFNYCLNWFVRAVVHGESCANFAIRHVIHHRYPKILNIDTGIFLRPSTRTHQCNKTRNLLFGYRFLYRYFGSLWFAPILVLFWYPYYRVVSILYVIKSMIERKNTVYCAFDALGITLHYVSWAVILGLSGFSAWSAICVYILFWSVSAIWFIGIGSAIHENCPVIDPKCDDIDAFVEENHYPLQFICAQNIRSNWVSQWLYMGLDRHIEHHLFPSMSAFQFRKATPILKAFAKQHNLPYLSYPVFSGAISGIKAMTDPLATSLTEAIEIQRAK